MADALCLTAHIPSQVNAVQTVLCPTPSAQDAFAKVAGFGPALVLLRSDRTRAIAISPECLTDLEVDGPEADSATLSARGRRADVRVSALGLTDDSLFELLTLQEVAHLPEVSLNLSLVSA